MGKLDDLLANGGASVDELARAGREDGMTPDETARELIARGRLRKEPVSEGRELTEDEMKRRLDERDDAYFMIHPVTGTVTTGGERGLTEAERLSRAIEQGSGGRKRVGRMEDGRLYISEYADDGVEVRTALPPVARNVTEAV